MRQLLIDRGNTALKWRIVDGNEILAEGRSLNDRCLSDVFSSQVAYRLTDIYASSVGDNMFCKALIDWAAQNNQPVPVFVESSRAACGVVNGYQEPAKLGVDRWLALIAAHHRYSGMLCVVDSGTALTMDFLMPDGRHLGGYIVPGASLMKASLLTGTAKIKVQSDAALKGLGNTTTEAVLLGIEGMLKAFVSNKVVELEAEHGQAISVVLTGGHAETLSSGLSFPVHLDNNLVLRGLGLLVEAAK